MPMESTLRPSSAPAVSTVQLVRRRSFGKVVRVDLASPASAPTILSPARADDRGMPGSQGS